MVDVDDSNRYHRQPDEMFEIGNQFPRDEDLERLAKYKRMRKIYEGKIPEVLERATKLLKDSPHEKQLESLYIAVNVVDLLVTKPADLLVGDGIVVESGEDDESRQQKVLDRIAQDNNLTSLIHEMVIGAGIRSDAFVKAYYNNRADLTALTSEGLSVPTELQRLEPVIEAVPADIVFPVTVKNSNKKFKAINICTIEFKNEYSVGEWVEVPYLNVEKHLPGYIIYKRFRLADKYVDNSYDEPIALFTLQEEVSTGRENNIVETGVPDFLVKHIPYKSMDDSWKGTGGIEKLESLLAAINDRLVQIDYILWKHSDPVAYGVEIDGKDSLQWGGKYIPLEKDDPTPGYMTWDGRLEYAFKELDYLLSLVYQIAETPQWLFGTTVAGESGGTGTSHTDSRAIKLRLMPVVSKVNRIKLNVDKAIRDILYLAQRLELKANQGVSGFEEYEPVYPKIYWYEPLPSDEHEEAEIMDLRTGGKPTLDVQTAIKRMDNKDDQQSKEIIKRIQEDETRQEGMVDGSIFNQGTVGEEGDA